MVALMGKRHAIMANGKCFFLLDFDIKCWIPHIFHLKFDWPKVLLCKHDLGGQLNESIKIKVGKNKESFSGRRNMIRKFFYGIIIYNINGHRGVHI